MAAKAHLGYGLFWSSVVFNEFVVSTRFSYAAFLVFSFAGFLFYFLIGSSGLR